MPSKPRTPKAPETSKAPRTRRTPQQKAEQALGVADRRVAALVKHKTKHEKALAQIDLELVDATRRRQYLAQSPDLPQTLDADKAQNSKETPNE